MDREDEAGARGEAAPTQTEYTEKIALIVQPIWTYYRYQLCNSIPPRSVQANIASGTPQRILDAFPELTRAEACFLGLIWDIISDADLQRQRQETPFEGTEAKVDREDAVGAPGGADPQRAPPERGGVRSGFARS